MEDYTDTEDDTSEYSHPQEFNRYEHGDKPNNWTTKRHEGLNAFYVRYGQHVLELNLTHTEGRACFFVHRRGEYS
jgi:hypothetical protein